MTPRAKKYGVKYYFSKDYRRKVKNRENTLVQREKYGSFVGNRQSLKDALYTKQRGHCNWCRFWFPKEQLTIDHIIKVTEGGDNKFRNLRLLCKTCHEIKDAPTNDNKPFAEAFKKLKHELKYEAKK